MVKPASSTSLSCFAATSPGLESVAAEELAKLKLAATAVHGGAEFSGNLRDVARANLWLRSASRVIVRLAQFRARTFFELERQAARVAWDRYLSAGARVDVRVTCKKSALYHSDAVAQRVFEAIATRVPDTSRADGTDDEASAAQRFIVRLFKDQCTVSVDSSGALLHMRGYRKAVAKAPLRETLAASVLLAAGWNGGIPLEDPFCGSGTIAIEAALIARRIPPGLHRSFAFQQWAHFDGAEWGEQLARAKEGMFDQVPATIVGADRDDGAIRAARENAERAGVSNDVAFEMRAISDLPARDGPGLIAINPPYGVRIGEGEALRNLYARLGDVLRHNRPGWDLAMLASDPALVRQTRLHFDTALRTTNGGIAVRALTAKL